MNGPGGIASAFWNGRERRLRAGWRLLLQFVLFFVVLIGVTVAGRAAGPGPRGDAIGAALYLGLGVGLTWILARLVDRRPFRDFGFHLESRWWVDLGFGFAVGAALMSGIFFTERGLGWVAVTVPGTVGRGLAAGRVVLLDLLVFTAVAVNEELAFRGYELRNLAEGLAGGRLGARAAVATAWLTSSLVFGLAHLFNDNPSVTSTLNIVLVSAALVGLPYVLTGELAIPIGLHLSWNLFQGTVYGFPVSGELPSRRLLVPEQGGPVAWTGGGFGPEGGLLATLAAAVGCVAIVLWIRGRYGPIALHAPLARYEPRRRIDEGAEGMEP